MGVFSLLSDQSLALWRNGLVESSTDLTWTNRRRTARCRGVPAREFRAQGEITLASDPLNGIFSEFHRSAVAGVAQLAEHRFCKPTVVSSTLTASSVRQTRRIRPDRIGMIENEDVTALSRSYRPSMNRVDTQVAKGARL